MSFGADLNRFEKKTSGKGSEAIQKIAMDLFKGVILMSPVGNPDLWKHPVRGYVGGRFKGNWQAGINRAPGGELETKDEDGGATVSKMVAAVDGRAKGGDSVYLVNNLPYALRLEDGWSNQAPGGMVALTLQRADGVVRKVASELNRK